MGSVPARILVVEDDPDIAQLIKHTLERGGDTKVDIVGSGDAALKAVNDAVPDLLLLDLSLPVLDGTEVCRMLRARPATSRLPIIMLTARTEEADMVSGLDLGSRRLRNEAVPAAGTGGAGARRAAAAIRQGDRRCRSIEGSTSPRISTPSPSPWTASRCGSLGVNSNC